MRRKCQGMNTLDFKFFKDIKKLKNSRQGVDTKSFRILKCLI